MKTQTIYAAQNIYKYILTIPLLLVFFLVCFPNNIHAADLTLGTAPTSEKLQLDPGETYNGEIVVWNLSTITTKYNVIVSGFEQIENQPGTAIMLSEEAEAKALYSASSWVTVDRKSINLIPNKNEKLYYTIKVPKNATKGEYNVIIAFMSESETRQLLGTGALSTLTSGTPILIKVGDEFLENAELLEFSTDKNFYEFPNINFLTKIKNLGDTHITPIGEIVLTNMFGKEIARVPFNENTQSILRGNMGIYTSDWDYGKFLTNEKELVIGKIAAKIIITYRSFQPGFHSLTSETTFWVIPWRYILIALIIIILTMIIVRRLTKKKKEYKPIPK
jgi:hypothetical protein